MEGRVRPEALRNPPEPPGIERVSVAEGTNGAVAENCSCVGVTLAQFPATGGERVGSGLFTARGSDRVTASVAPGSTLVAPLVGVVLATLNGAAGRGGAVSCCGAEAPPERESAKAAPPPTTTTTASTAITNKVDIRQRGAPAALLGAWAPRLASLRRMAIVYGAIVGNLLRPCSVIPRAGAVDCTLGRKVLVGGGVLRRRAAQVARATAPPTARSSRARATGSVTLAPEASRT